MTNDNAATKFLVQDLDLYYGKFQALKKINLDIKEKKITALIGPSGCGKSTFLKTLNRRLTPSACVTALVWSSNSLPPFRKAFMTTLLTVHVSMA